MDLSVFQYQGPVWTLPTLGWEIPFLLTLVAMGVIVFLWKKFMIRYAQSRHQAEYRRRIASLSLDDPHFISELSLLVRSYLDVSASEGWHLVSTGREWRSREGEGTLRHLSLLFDTLLYARMPTREEKEKIRKTVLDTMSF